MPESNGNKHRDYSKFDNMSTEILEDILRADSHLPDSENSDSVAILYIMEVIARREKEKSISKFTDVHNAWASFSKNYLPYTEDETSLYDFEDEEKAGIKQKLLSQPLPPVKKRRLIRLAYVAAVVTTLLFATTITASAFGFDLWGAVAKWTKDTFGFTSSVANSDPSPQISSKVEGNSLQATIKKYGITTNLVPTWLPEEYVLKNINVNETPAQKIIAAQYSDKNSEIFIKIVLLNKPSTRMYEKDDKKVTVYLVHGTKYYIMSNIESSNISWQAENCECSIAGSFTLNEAKKMIDSIYERN